MGGAGQCGRTADGSMIAANSLARFGSMREVRTPLVVTELYESEAQAPRRKSRLIVQRRRGTAVLAEPGAAAADTRDTLQHSRPR